MRLLLDGVEVRGSVGGAAFAEVVPLGGAGGPAAVRVGPVEVRLVLDLLPSSIDWSVANAGDEPVEVRGVALVFEVDAPATGLRMLRHGYQSWSETSVATLGVDADPSLAEGSIRLVRGMHHADEDLASPGELRSESVTVLRSAPGALVLAGFVAGHDHDGTFRLRPPAGDGPGRRPDLATLRAEAHLGGARLAPGEERALHRVVVDEGDDPAALLEAWAGRVGAVARARTGGPYQVGWCSWYHYFHELTEADVRANLALAGDWPFEVFQVDDGYQAAIGDWLVTNDRFPSSVDEIAAAIRDAGRVPGIWLAPFLVAPDSQVAGDHPDWIARDTAGEPLLGMWNPGWGGATWALDTTNPEVLDHVAATARSLVEAGFPYVKLDFTYAPSLDGTWHDPARTPAQRVRAGFEAVRRGAGDAAFLLGCGAPLGPTVGLVDGMRIGPDVAPSWDVQPDQFVPPGYEPVVPSTRSAWRATLARSFMHRRLWLNDPDCLMLRTEATRMAPASVEAWAHAVAASGGMALVSDDLSLLGPDARRLLDEVVATGRAVDHRAAAGRPPRCPDLLDAATPSRLVSDAAVLTGDPDAGTATLDRP